MTSPEQFLAEIEKSHDLIWKGAFQHSCNECKLLSLIKSHRKALEKAQEHARILQRRLCGYSSVEGAKNHLCDCKFLTLNGEDKHGGEATGCCEARTIIRETKSELEREVE